MNEYPEPTQIVIGEDTDMSKIGNLAFFADQKQINQSVKRNLIGIKEFNSESAFMAWQHEEPREIFEITPLVVNASVSRIFVTYNAGIIG
jgi:hypothetical protein